MMARRAWFYYAGEEATGVPVKEVRGIGSDFAGGRAMKGEDILDLLGRL